MSIAAETDLSERWQKRVYRGEIFCGQNRSLKKVTGIGQLKKTFSDRRPDSVVGRSKTGNWARHNGRRRSLGQAGKKGILRPEAGDGSEALRFAFSGSVEREFGRLRQFLGEIVGVIL